MDYKIVEDSTIFLSVIGSTCHGTNLPSSDIDEAGILIAPKEYYIGNLKFEQADKWTDKDGKKIDKVIYSFDKIISLMIENNPNCLDLLFVDEKFIKIMKPEWKRIRDIRDCFLSTKVKHSYSGYHFSQIERIYTHRSYILNPIQKPTREKFGLKEKSIFPDTQVQVISRLATDYIEPENKELFRREVSQILDNELTTIFRKYLKPELVSVVMSEFKIGQKEYLRTLESISSIYLKDEYLEEAGKELKWLSAYNNWKRYEEWKTNRNPKRQLLEAKAGYDSKHGAISLMILRQGIEILEGKGLIVDRTGIDAEELINIRLGNVKFEDLLSESKKLQEKLDSAYWTSFLSRSPDKDKIQNVKMDILERYLFKRKKWLGIF